MKCYFFLFILLITFISCQEVSVGQNERGVLFKRFDGGVDTTQILEPGNYTISNWNYIFLYHTNVTNGKMEFKTESKIQYSVNYQFRLIKEKIPHYHSQLGGPRNKKVKDVLQEALTNLASLNNTLISEDALDRKSNEILIKCKPLLANKYIDLIAVTIKP